MKIFERLLLALCICMCIPNIIMLSGCSHTHSYKKVYSFNESYHWQICTTEHCDSLLHYQKHADLNMDEICDDCHYGAAASVTQGEHTSYYTTVKDAFNSVTTSTPTTISLFDSSVEKSGEIFGSGIVVESNRNITFDLNNCKYILTAPAVGSKGTTSSGFQLLKNSNVTFKNGTITHKTINNNIQDANETQLLIQNYSNLTLENVTLIAKNPADETGTCLYALSNNYGNVILKGNTNIYADNVRSNGSGGVAFDLWYNLQGAYAEGVSVTIDQSFTGVIDGKIEYGAARKTTNWTDLTVLKIYGGIFTAEEFTRASSFTELANIQIYGGVFSFDVSAFVANGYKCVYDQNVYRVVPE